MFESTAVIGPAGIDEVSDLLPVAFALARLEALAFEVMGLPLEGPFGRLVGKDATKAVLDEVSEGAILVAGAALRRGGRQQYLWLSSYG